METTSYLSSTIQRIARKQRKTNFLLFGVILIIIFGCIGILWLGSGDPLYSWGFLFILAALAVGGFAYFSTRSLTRAIHDPLESFYLNNLQHYGTLEEVVAQIDLEAQAYVGREGTFLTPHWLISAQGSLLEIIRLEDIVWVYKRVHENKVTLYNAVTVSKSENYSAEIWTRHGAFKRIVSSEQGVDKIITQIVKAVPWVTQGHLDILHHAWNTRRAEFIADVDRKKQKFLSPRSEEEIEFLDSDPVEDNKPQNVGQVSAILSDLNQAVDHKLIDDYAKKNDRSVRIRGFFILAFGAGLLAFLVLGFFINPQASSFSVLGICTSIIITLLGVVHLAFGQKGKTFYEKTLFKDWWSIALAIITICGGMMFLNMILEFLFGIAP